MSRDTCRCGRYLMFRRLGGGREQIIREYVDADGSHKRSRCPPRREPNHPSGLGKAWLPGLEDT